MPDPTDVQDARRSRLVTGDLRTTLFILALPVLFEQFLSFCVGFYDTWLSGQMEDIGADATSAIGLAAYVGWLASMLFGLVGIGTTALVARHCGAGEFDQANRVMNRAMALALVMGGVAFALIFSAAPLFAWLLDLPDDTRRIVVNYLRVDAVGYLFSSLSLAGAAALRGTGDTRTPMMVLGTVSVLNVVVSTALVFGVGPWPALGLHATLIRPMGIDGIVLGTVSARFCGGMLMLAVLAAGRSGLRLARSEWTLRGELVRRILRIGLPAAADGSIMWAGHFAFLTVVSQVAGGKFAFAAHVVGIQVEAITYLPAVAWGHAAAAMTGQALGAQRPQRALRVGHEAVLQCTLLAAVIAVVFFTAARPIYELMHRDEAVREIGIPAFRMLAFFQVPLAVSIIYVHALRGAGDTRSPMLITLFGVLAVRLPVAWFFGIVLDGGLIGAWIGMCADIAVRAVLVAVRYLGGRWLETAV